MQYSEILRRLKSLSNTKAVEGMARFRINPKNTYGVSIPSLRMMAKEIGRNHLLAQQLLSSSIGKRNVKLNKAAIQTAKEIQRLDSKSANGLLQMQLES